VSIRTTARRTATKKVVGSLGVLGAAAAVAGLGTLGGFTDSTTPVDTQVDTGVVSIALNPAANYATVPVVTGGLLPGDTSATPFNLVNDGTAAWGSVSFRSWATSSSRLDSDPVHGLQLSLESCSVPWAVAGPGTYSCPGTVTDFYTGPVIMDTTLANAASVTPGQVDHLLATIEFPSTAGNTFTGQTSGLAFTFTAVQRDGAVR
jgi:hypothetical protein